MATASAIAFVGSTVISTVQQKKARREEQRAAAIERRAAEVNNLRERKRALAARQRGEAQAAVAGQQSGIGATSGGVLAEQASLGSQFGSNIGFAQELTALNADRLNALERANKAISIASNVQSFGQAVSSVSGAYQEAKARQEAALKKGSNPNG